MSPNKVIIHVGMQKAASSFLQQAFFPYLSDFTLLTRPYTQLNHAWNKLQYAPNAMYNKQLILNELRQLQSKDLIISDESFEGNTIGLTHSNRDAIARRLYELFPEATIVVVIRDQVDWLKSLYGQYLKSHKYGIKSFDEFIYKPLESYSWKDVKEKKRRKRGQFYFNTSDFVIQYEACQISDLLSTYKLFFSNIKVYFFEDFQTNSVLIFQDIFNKDQLSKLLNKPSVHINSRFNSSKLKRYKYAKRIYLKRQNYSSTLYTKGLSFVKSILDRKELYNITDEKMNYILDVAHKDCLKLKELHGLDMEKFDNKYLNRSTFN